MTIEHAMPQAGNRNGPQRCRRSTTRWQPLSVTRSSTPSETPTLVTGNLNPYVSNNPWLATTTNGKPVPGKRDALNEHSVLRLNNRLVTHRPDAWTEHDIRARTHQLAERVAAIWPAPPHRP